VTRKFEAIADFYKVERLSDLVSEDEITVMVAGFSDQLDLPIVIAQFDNQNNLKVYSPFRFSEFLHPACLKAREEHAALCETYEEYVLREFIANDDVKPVELCWDGGVYFRRGIRIAGVPVAIALGGGYRVMSGQIPSEEDKKYIQAIITYGHCETVKVDDRAPRPILEDRRLDLVDWDRFKADYGKFISTVAIVEGIARDRFRSKRFDLEHKFFDELRVKTFGIEFHLPKEEKEFKEAHKWALKEMNSFCGYSSSVLMMHSKEEGLFKVYVSALDSSKEKRIVSFKPSPVWESCFKWGKPIYFQPGLNMSRLEEKSAIDTGKLLTDIEFLFPFESIRRCCIVPFTAEDRRWLFFFFNEVYTPPLGDFFWDDRRMMESFCSQISSGMSRAFAEMDRRDYLDRVAHETINPIGKVKWHAQFIKMNYSNIEKKDVNRKLDDIINECDRAIKTAETILKLSGKIEIKLKPKKIDFFEKIAKPIIHEVRYGREDLYIDYMDIAKMPLLNIDSNLVYDVMFNILDNAVKYSSKHTTIVFSYRHQEDGIVICVSNIGIGIPEGEDEKIFRVGTRGSNASLVNVRGTGQGLAICKMNIEEKLGGKIWFDRGRSTDQGKEIIFKVFLPEKYVAGGENG
jgi:signal transduction histidine kinase